MYHGRTIYVTERLSNVLISLIKNHFSLEFIQINTDLSTHTQIVIMEFFVNIKNLNAYKWDQ